MNIPFFVRQVNRMFTNNVFSTFAWLVPPFAMLTHVGRKSGRLHRTPIAAFRSDEGFAVPLWYGRDVDWVRNVLKAGAAEIEHMGLRIKVYNPRLVEFDEAAGRLPPMLRPGAQMADLPGWLLLDFERERKRRPRKARRAPGEK